MTELLFASYQPPNPRPMHPSGVHEESLLRFTLGLRFLRSRTSTFLRAGTGMGSKPFALPHSQIMPAHTQRAAHRSLALRARSPSCPLDRVQYTHFQSPLLIAIDASARPLRALAVSFGCSLSRLRCLSSPWPTYPRRYGDVCIASIPQLPSFIATPLTLLTILLFSMFDVHRRLGYSEEMWSFAQFHPWFMLFATRHLSQFEILQYNHDYSLVYSTSQLDASTYVPSPV
ncbi:hypothetical protein K474DRAFT_1676313 [Panus rudis PR-1116 ss-1]|nr:hypothetical protein K474DRAFT_1676313 [Panus rudis PR-1116 ss-1]